MEPRSPLPPEVAASFARDPERWTLSYSEHTATALRQRAEVGMRERAIADLAPFVRVIVGADLDSL